MSASTYIPKKDDILKNKSNNDIIKIVSVGQKSAKAVRIDLATHTPIGVPFTIFNNQFDGYELVGGDEPPVYPKSKRFTFDLDENGNLTIKQNEKIVSVFEVRGPKGEKGNQGETGPRGDQGIQGAQGVPGVNGSTWTPVITDDGEKLYFVSSNGEKTETYPIRGAKGESGDKGIPGDKGEKGDQGPAGANGANGDTWKPEVSADGETLVFRNSKDEVVGPFSIKGAQGKQGEQGVRGLPGAKGEQGATGPKGEDAESWTPVISEDRESLQFISNKGNKSPIFQIRGPQGYQGVQGIPGIKGEEGKTFTPHYDGEWLWFEDKEGNRPFPPTHVKGDKGDKGERGKSAYELWRDDPLHPENAGKTLDDYLQSLKGEDGRVVNTYHNELSELEDYTCPIHKISPYMIVSTDTLQGSESAEETIEYEKARIQKLRAEGEKYANHGSWIQEFFWWCAGADRALLRMCPGEHSKYMGIGTVIFFTALMAWFSSFVALGIVTGESTNPKSTVAIILPIAILIIGSLLTFIGYKRYKLNRLRDHLDNLTDDGIIRSSIQRFNSKIWWIVGIIIASCLLIYCIWGKGVSTYISWAALFACAWSLMIFFLDRFITNTMYSDGKVTISWLELRSALPRIVIAIFLGVVISAPLELIIFDKEVNLAITNYQEAYITERVKQNTDSISAIESQLEELNKQKIAREDNSNTNTNISESIIEENKLHQNNLQSINQNYPLPSYPWGDRESNPSGWRNYDERKAEANEARNKERTEENNRHNNRIKELNSSKNNETSVSTITEQIKSLSLIKSNLEANRLFIQNNAKSEFDKQIGLGLKLKALHSLAMDEHDDGSGYTPWDTSVSLDNMYNPWYWFFGILIVLILTTWPFYKNVIKDDGSEVKGAFVIIPWLIVVSAILAYCNNTIFHALPSYIFSAVGMIMMLFILIDVSPVFYKMMLADGVYDKILHKEKLLTEDAIRLNAAKSFAKVNDSAIGRLAPFVFGKTAGKLMDMLKEFKSKSSEIDTNKDGRPEMGYGQSQERKDIETTNSEVFSYVLSLKKRLVKASYLAWYRDMRDHVLATKEDNQTPPGQPEDEFSEFDDDREPDFNIELDRSELTMQVGETAKLTASVSPQNESTPEIDWLSRDENIAKVSDGEITAISLGITEIIATCGEGFASCKVSVIHATPNEDTDGDDDGDNDNDYDANDNNNPPSGSPDSEGIEDPDDSKTSGPTFSEDFGSSIEDDDIDADQDEDDEHEIEDDETFRDINK